MGTYVDIGEIVEGKKCDIVTRKHIWKGIAKDPITNCNMTLYELDRNCSVTVSEEVVLSSAEEKECRDSHNVHGKLGDEIRAYAIQLFVDVKRNCLKFRVSEGQSSTHGAELEHTSTRTIGRIKYPLDIYKKQFGYLISFQDKKSIQ